MSLSPGLSDPAGAGASVASDRGAEGSWITFLSHRSGGNRLYRMRPDGSELTPIFGGELRDLPGLSEGQALHRQPHGSRQSPDRRFFLSWAIDVSSPEETFPAPVRYMIHLGRTDGGPTRVLAPDGQEVFAWAPGSRRFAYSRTAGPDPRTVTGLAPKVPSTQVVVLGVDGSHEEVVLEKPGYWAACDWSPDGTRLLLLYRPTISTRFGRSDLIELDLTAARHQRGRMEELRPDLDFASGPIVEYCLRSLTDAQPIGWFENARYSPDGSRIAVAFSRRTQLVGLGFHELGVFDIAGETLEPVAEFPDPEWFFGPISWSPDGSEILLSRPLAPGDGREDTGDRDQPGPGIWAIRPDGTGTRFMTTGWCPDWR